MTGSWIEQWKTGNERVVPNEGAWAENQRVTETLQAGQAYEKKLTMRLASGKPGKKVTFRMGFTPVGGKRTVWGNEVVLQVEGEPAAKQGKEPSSLRSRRGRRPRRLRPMPKPPPGSRRGAWATRKSTNSRGRGSWSATNIMAGPLPERTLQNLTRSLTIKGDRFTMTWNEGKASVLKAKPGQPVSYVDEVRRVGA